MYRGMNDTPESQAFITNLHALKRVATPEELARSVLYLASDDCGLRHRHGIAGRRRRLDHPHLNVEERPVGGRVVRDRLCRHGRATAFALRCDSDLGQLALIRAGAGIGVCQVALASRDPSFVRVLADKFSLKLTTWVAMHEGCAAARDVGEARSSRWPCRGL